MTEPTTSGEPHATPAPDARAAARRLRDGLAALSVIDTVAVGVIVGLLVWIDRVAAPHQAPFLVASFASSVIILFALPDLDIARSWSVIGGQLLGGLAGLLCGTLVPGPVGVVAGCAVALSFVAMRLAHAVHPPGGATALVVAVQPHNQTIHFLVFPILAGSVTIVVFAWAVHLLDRYVLTRFTRRDRRS